jgi:hypothetical protein
VIRNGADSARVNLGKFGMEFANLMLVPKRRTEPVMGDGRDHEKPGRRRIQALIHPVGELHTDLLLVHGNVRYAPFGLLDPVRALVRTLTNLTAGLVNRHHMADVISQQRLVTRSRILGSGMCAAMATARSDVTSPSVTS